MAQGDVKNQGSMMGRLIQLLALVMILAIAQLGMVTPADAGKANKEAKKIERQKKKIKRAQNKESRFEKRRKDRRIVMFDIWVDQAEREAYLKEMSKKKIKLVKAMPYLNSAVLRVPRSISNDELAADERVVSAVTNHKTRLRKGRKAERLRIRDADSGAELVYISGDGLAGDGGSGDGGSGDGSDSTRSSRRGR